MDNTMNLQTFRAPTMKKAWDQVKETLGSEAVILHTRTLQTSKWLGLKRSEVVEITAGRGINIRQHKPKPSADPRPGRAHPPLNTTTAAPSRNGPLFGPKSPILQTPVATSATILDMSKQIGDLKKVVGDLATEVHRQSKPQVPEELFDAYTTLLSRRINDQVAGELIISLQRALRPEQFQQPEVIKQKLVDQIERMIPTSGPINRSKMIGPHVVALIGPTGVGKTTTIAKLAANMRLRDKQRVGLITIDTYRIAAIDQLKKYADIIGSQLKVVTSPEDLKAAVESFSDCDYVLIDTAGRSPADALKLHELKSFLVAAKPDEVHLVINATANQDCAEFAIEKFGDVRIDRVIFTKLDETPSVGMLLNVVRKVNKPLSYVTNGQDVPDDIEVTHSARLANLILGNTV